MSGPTSTDLDALLAHLGSDREHDSDALTIARFANSDLKGADLAGQDLSGVDLSGADLTGAKLNNADLTGAILHGSRISGATFLGATLVDVDASNAEAHGITAAGVDASGASFAGADLSGSSLTKATLTRADLRGARLAECRLRDADLSGVDGFRADLTGTDLEGADVDKATFRDSDMSRAHVRGLRNYDSADWIGTTLRDIDYTGAYLIRRHMVDQNYLHEFSSQSPLHRWIYLAWKITSNCGRSFARWATLTFTLAALYSFAYLAVDIDYGAYHTPLSPLYYSLVTMTTLGYGDVLPASGPAQIVALAEVVTGYFMLGGLLGIFANKMSRRAD